MGCGTAQEVELVQQRYRVRRLWRFVTKTTKAGLQTNLTASVGDKRRIRSRIACARPLIKPSGPFYQMDNLAAWPFCFSRHSGSLANDHSVSKRDRSVGDSGRILIVCHHHDRHIAVVTHCPKETQDFNAHGTRMLVGNSTDVDCRCCSGTYLTCRRYRCHLQFAFRP